MTAAPGSWVLRGACRRPDVDPDLFFPSTEHGRPEYARRVAAAKEICRGCSVRAACLDWALQELPEHGIAGGLTAGERRSARRPSTQLGEITDDAELGVTLARLYQSGTSIAALSAACGRSSDSVRRTLRRAGITLRPGRRRSRTTTTGGRR